MFLQLGCQFFQFSYSSHMFILLDRLKKYLGAHLLVFHWIIACISVKVRSIDCSCGIRANPPSHFWIVITISKIHESNLFIDPLSTISPRVSDRRIRNCLTSLIDDFFFPIDRIMVGFYDLILILIHLYSLGIFFSCSSNDQLVGFTYLREQS
jgi:hypothetical protein